MKYIFGNLLVIFTVGIIVVFLSNFAFPQQTAEQKSITNLNTDSCINVTLVADSNKLEEENPISLVVRIINDCDERVKLNSEPFFLFDKVKANIETPTRFGDQYIGRIVRNKTQELDNTSKCIEPKSYLEFALDTNELKWQDIMSSQDVLQSIFKNLGTGEYYLQAKVLVEVSNENKVENRKFLSNQIKIQYDKK